MVTTDDTKFLLDRLIKERNYHSSHPHEVAVNFFYSLGVSLATVIGSIYLSGKTDKEELQKFVAAVPMGLVLTLLASGLVLIFAGMAEHSHLHAQQRKKIEEAINFILAKFDQFDYQAFLNQFQTYRIKYLFGNDLKKDCTLFSQEPDTRALFKFHDMKINIGILLILAAYGILIYHAFN